MSRELMFLPDASEDYLYWQEQDRKMLRRINRLIEECRRTPDAGRRTPDQGIGKPEPFKGELAGYWSRRLNETDRLVYRWTDEQLVVIPCRGHC